MIFKMKKHLYIILAMVSLAVCPAQIIAQTTENTNLFPKKGYNIKWIKRTKSGFDDVSCEIKKFKDCDSLYYIVYNRPDIRRYCIQFSLLDEQGAQELAVILSKLSRKERISFMKDYLYATHANDLNHISRYNEYWTYFKPKINERNYIFSSKTALYAYHIERQGRNSLKKITPTEWYLLIKMMSKMPVDNRSLYDKIVNPNDI